MNKILIISALLIGFTVAGCKKEENSAAGGVSFRFISLTVNGENKGFTYTGVNVMPVIKITFSDKIDMMSASAGVSLASSAGTVPVTTTFENNNTTLVVQPSADLSGFTRYTLTVTNALLSESKKALSTPVTITLNTGVDGKDKFDRITDDELLTLVQQQTFKYFWDFAHPVSGLARERNTSGDIVTSGGSGFGIMAIVAAIHRQLITRQEGLAQLTKIVGFLKNTAQTFHGAYPHWLNGATGEAVPFSEKDNGADIVETSYLMQGLLTARQYFNGAEAEESTLRNDINIIWNKVEWDWFRNNDQEVLYWHWSPDYEWQMNHPVRGWNESLITYVLAASSTNHSIPKSVYDNGWAQGGAMANNFSYYGISLPLGPAFGGPLFFAHYSFLGIDPQNLQDAYANYWTQNVAHTMINYKYCVDNPEEHAGYGADVWGLTASDNQSGYSAHSPENDLGVISPTAALSSMPYTPEESMAALKYFYYKLGDKLFKEYGFVDAFNLNIPWFADSFLAIDQGPIIIMIENYRSGLLWDLFMSSPEVKSGMAKLGFQSPHF